MRHSFFLGILLISTSCSQSFDSPDAVVTAFLDRSIGGEAAAARECLVADEQQQIDLKFHADPGTEFELGTWFPEDDHRVVPVRFPAQGETLDFVVVDRGNGPRISLAMTLTRGMTKRVQAQVEQLGENATPEEMAEAMRRGMNAAPAGR